MPPPGASRAVPAAGYDDRQVEGLIELMFLAVHADGEFSDEERNELASNVRSLSSGRIAGETFKTLVLRIEKDLAAEGRAQRLAALKLVFPDESARIDALAIVVRMVAADGVVRTSERDLILEVADGLEIDGGVAADLVAQGTAT